METAPIRQTEKEADDIYLRIWESEQRHTTTRWTVTTFFLSISFAIFAISLQIEKPIVPRVVPQFLAVIIYWFAYLLFQQFNAFTHFLRQYLRDMETSEKTSIRLQSASQSFMNKKRWLSATHLLIYFGIAYTLAAIVLRIVYP